MNEISCQNCQAACCKGPMTIELTKPEYTQMSEVGTDLITVADPVPYNRNDVPHPAGVSLILEHREEAVKRIEKEGERWPLTANMGRYILVGSCGNLRTLLGWERCNIYGQRPRACRNLEVGEIACKAIRQEKGVDPLGPESTLFTVS